MKKDKAADWMRSAALKNLKQKDENKLIILRMTCIVKSLVQILLQDICTGLLLFSWLE